MGRAHGGLIDDDFATYFLVLLHSKVLYPGCHFDWFEGITPLLAGLQFTGEWLDKKIQDREFWDVIYESFVLLSVLWWVFFVREWGRHRAFMTLEVGACAGGGLLGVSPRL